MQDPLYIPLLQNLTYHNLDEKGTQINREYVVDEGRHSISEIQKRYIGFNVSANRAESGNDKEHIFSDPGESLTWAGPVRWWQGSLQIIHGSPEFPAGRELLFYHHPETRIDFPDGLRDEIFEDMMKYGYLLPSLIPLLTRYICKTAGVNSASLKESMHAFKPYDPSCFGRGGHLKHSVVDPSGEKGRKKRKRT